MKQALFMVLCFSFLVLLAGCNTATTSSNMTTSGGNQTQAEKTEKVPEPLVVDGEKQYINDNTYLYYYGQTCSHCKKVEDYLKDSGVDQRIHIVPKEVQMNRDNQQELLAQAEELNIPTSQVGTPFVVVQVSEGTDFALIGEEEVIDYFKELEAEIRAL